MARPRKSHIAENSANASVELNAEKDLSAVATSVNVTGADIAELLTLVKSLKNEIDQLKLNQSSQKQAETLSVESDNKNTYIIENKDDDDDEFDKIEIRPETYVKIVSLFPGWLNISTRAHGKGKPFTFQSFGQVKRILYSDLVEILENYRHFLEKGYFYIMNKNVIRKNGLDEICNKILSKENIEIILQGNGSDNIISLFKSANVFQQETIIDMLISKMLVEEVDLNLIDKLSRISKIDIHEKFESAKQLQERMNSKE